MKYEKYKKIVIDDTGLGGGVTDMVQDFNEQEDLKRIIIPVNFAEAAINDSDYDGIVTEMWFHTKELIESQIINVVDNGKLFAELSNRKYKYTNKGKFKVESKDDYKKRTDKESPDEADAFILCQWGNKTYVAEIETHGERETAEQW